MNYTQEMIDRMKEVYDPKASDEDRDAQVAELAAELDRKEASVRAKLVREGVYVAKTKPSKNGGVRKADLVQSIADALEVDVDVIGSLEKATKVALTRVIRGLNAA